MAPSNDPPLQPRSGGSGHELKALQKKIVGRWITSFGLEFPQGTGFLPTAFLSCFKFEADLTFSLVQRRNKGGTYEKRVRGGNYTIVWDPETDVAGGDISINSSDRLVLHYFMRSSDQLHWIMDGSVPPIPVSQGTMYRAELVKPGS